MTQEMILMSWLELRIVTTFARTETVVMFLKLAVVDLTQILALVQRFALNV